jgi:beta-phosphoglucomutase-like phosphatase (HAD superfamily)
VVIEDSAQGARAGLAAGRGCWALPHGSETPTARAVAALGVPLFHRMDDLPGLLGI